MDTFYTFANARIERLRKATQEARKQLRNLLQDSTSSMHGIGTVLQILDEGSLGVNDYVPEDEE